uniref:WLM domain-containing protein n=1 Tax=viral metagenome TaxID=1070528 RepID=A0A6C0H7G2_9ZZZZ
MIYYLIYIILIIYIFHLFHNINIINIESLKGYTITIYNDEQNDYKKKLLNDIIVNMTLLKEHLVNNIKNFPNYEIYILQLNKNFNKTRTRIYETNPSTSLTSYSVNKGEELSICLKSKLNNSFHDINLLTYVAIHEMSHFANPEIGHGELFQDIFNFFIEEAIKINIYKKIDYSVSPTEYCGLIINTI